MREHEYKAWDASEHEMVDWPHLLNDPDDWFIDLLRGEGDEGDVILEWTGISDKTGVRIHEGDVVTDEQYPGGASNRYVIEFGFQSDASGYQEHLGWNITEDQELVVFGNIYENPELVNTPK